ncbi:hypothetical protein BD413DRAFT_24196 [Trametes elegans]|nr:hypothetical protein BD413DRAFT_24196 [Trametes elegans]
MQILARKGPRRPSSPRVRPELGPGGRLADARNVQRTVLPSRPPPRDPLAAHPLATIASGLRPTSARRLFAGSRIPAGKSGPRRGSGMKSLASARLSSSRSRVRVRPGSICSLFGVARCCATACGTPPQPKGAQPNLASLHDHGFQAGRKAETSQGQSSPSLCVLSVLNDIHRLRRRTRRTSTMRMWPSSRERRQRRPL